jgi:AmmeMemoRadiSam system protein A
MAMDGETKRELLDLARQAVLAASQGRPAPATESVAGADERFFGVFVTLRRGRHLRGCIGTFNPTGTLPEMVAQYAAYSAIHDTRFSPVNPSEVPHLNVEISVLSPLERTDDPASLEVGKHGIYLRSKIFGRETTACFLPQVATEQGWSAEQFLSVLCTHKCRPPLEPDAWRDPNKTEVYLFTAEIISESDPHAGTCRE